MEPLTNEKLITLYKCLLETCEILEFSIENVINVFNLDKSTSVCYNHLLIVIKDDDTHSFMKEMNTIAGATGISFIGRKNKNNAWNKDNNAWNKDNIFTYRVIFESVFNSVVSYHVIFDRDIDDNPDYHSDFSIIQEMIRLNELMAFV